MSQVCPIEYSLLFYPQLPRSVKHSYCLLKARAWDGQAAREITLTFDELMALWGDAGEAMSRTQTKSHLRLLKEHGFIQWTTNGDYRYRISFPVREELAGAEVGKATPAATTVYAHEVGIPTLQLVPAGNPTLTERAPAEVGNPTTESESDNNKTLSLGTISRVELQRLYAQALQAGKVFPNLRSRMAEELAAEGEKYLPHVLGHIACAFAGESGMREVGAYMRGVVAERLPVPDPRWLPPDDLTFQQAILWAKNGGPGATPAESTVSEDDADEGGEADESGAGGAIAPEPAPAPAAGDYLQVQVTAQTAWEMGVGEVRSAQQMSERGLKRSPAVGAQLWPQTGDLPEICLVGYREGVFCAQVASAEAARAWEGQRALLEMALGRCTRRTQQVELSVGAGAASDSVNTIAGEWRAEWNCGRAWEAALADLELEMTKGTFDTWVRGTFPLRTEPGRLVVGVPNVYAKDWLENRLLKTVGRALSRVLGHGVDVAFEVAAS